MYLLSEGENILIGGTAGCKFTTHNGSTGLLPDVGVDMNLDEDEDVSSLFSPGCLPMWPGRPYLMLVS
jgi:hypothetical protein